MSTPYNPILTSPPDSAPAAAAKINAMFTALFNGNSQFVDARDFAIDPTGANDSSVAINLALTQASSYNLPVKLPAGIFAIASVPVGYNAVGQGGQYALFGAGGMGGQLVGGSNLPTPRGQLSLAYNSINTVLVNYTQNLPTIIVNALNGAWVKDLGLIGLNVAATPFQVPIDNYANYLSSGIRGGPGITTSPYCAIAIDPLIQTSPPDGGYPGLTYANSYGSNLVLIENVPTQYFFVGIALSLSGTVAQNGSQVCTRNVTISCCDVAVAIGQSQSRLFTMTDGSIGSCRTVFDGDNYGAGGTGCPPSRLQGVNFGYFYRLFQLRNARGSCTVSKCYAESIRSLGVFGQGETIGSSALSFEGGDFTISQQSTWPPPPPLTLESYGTTKIEKCGFGFALQTSYPQVLNLVGGVSPIVLDSVSIGAGGYSKIFPPFVGYNVNATSQVVHRECQAGEALLSDIFPRSYGLAVQASQGRLIATYGTRFVPAGTTEYQYQPGGTYGLPEIQVTGCSALALTLNAWPTASSLTFNSTNWAAFQIGDILYWQAVIQPGSLIQWIVPMLKVTAVTNPTITCSLLFDPLCYDTVANWNTYHSGTMYVAPNEWAPTTTLTATCNGTTAVTLTGSAPLGCLQNGDWLHDSAGLLPGYARVASGGGTANIVLNIAATGSGSTNLYFGRLFPLALGTPI